MFLVMKKEHPFQKHPMISVLAAVALATLPAQPIQNVPVLTYGQDPTRSANITWRNHEMRGEIELKSKGKGSRKLGAKTQTTTLPSGQKWNYHSAFADRLRPGEPYQYRIPGGNWLQFRTPSGNQRSLRFLYFGDVQSNIDTAWQPILKLAYERCPDAAFMVFAGDLIDSAHDDYQWSDFFRPGEKYFGQIPVVATPGNHEYKSIIAMETARLSYHWKAQFEYPKNGYPGLDEQSYIVEFPQMRIISMNSNRFVKEQAAWLDKKLAELPSKWTFVTYHHPVFSLAKNRDNRLVRTLWDPVFRKHNVAMALQGHDHIYGRWIAPRADQQGSTTYITSVAGTKMYEPNPEEAKRTKKWMKRTRTFQIIEVSGNRLTYTSYDHTGKKVDSTVLQRSGTGAVQVIQ